MTETQTPQKGNGANFLIDVFRTRPWAKRAVGVVSVLLLIGGVAMLAYPFATNLYQNRLQDKLSKQLASPLLKQKYRNRAIGVGDSLTRIKMPTIHVDTVVVDKADWSVLNQTSDKTLPLTSCHPKGSAAKRIIVQAVWVKDLAGA